MIKTWQVIYLSITFLITIGCALFMPWYYTVSIAMYLFFIGLDTVCHIVRRVE